MKKGDVGMAKCFSIKYGNKGLVFNYLQSYDEHMSHYIFPQL